MCLHTQQPEAFDDTCMADDAYDNMAPRIFQWQHIQWQLTVSCMLYAVNAVELVALFWVSIAKLLPCCFLEQCGRQCSWFSMAIDDYAEA